MPIRNIQNSFRNKNLLFIDIETTGLDISKHEIIEIAAILVNTKNMKVISRFVIKVKADNIKIADPRALKITGYNNKEWKKAASLREALIKLSDFGKDAILIGWNIASDWSFLGRDYYKLKIEPEFDYHKLDAMSIAYAKLIGDDKYNHMRLVKVGPLLGFKSWKIHSALDDVTVTYKVFKKLMEL